MKPNVFTKLLIAALCGLTYSPAFATYVKLVESRNGGAAFVNNGAAYATTSAKSTATPLSGWVGGALTAGIGSYYAGQTTPSKTCDFFYTPDAAHAGYYNVYATWSANAYTGGMLIPTWTVNNADTAVNTSLSQATGGNAWNLLTPVSAVKLDATTQYSVHLATNPDAVSNKRTYADSVAWAAATATAVTALDGVANGSTGVDIGTASLSWTPGNYDYSFKVLYGLTAGSLTMEKDLVGLTTLSLSTMGLNDGTQYFWKVSAVNVDQVVPYAGSVFNFTTAIVPEPSTVALALMGGFALAIGAISRRKI